jgi:hypothetical protein
MLSIINTSVGEFCVLILGLNLSVRILAKMFLESDGWDHIE